MYVWYGMYGMYVCMYRGRDRLRYPGGGPSGTGIRKPLDLRWGSGQIGVDVNVLRDLWGGRGASLKGTFGSKTKRVLVAKPNGVW